MALESLAGVVATVVAELLEVGLHATDDQRDLNPPGVYVTPPIVTWDKLGAGYTAALDLYAVVPAAGRHEALEQLGPLVDQVRAVWPALNAFPYDLAPLEGTDPLPAYRMPLIVTVGDTTL